MPAIPPSDEPSLPKLRRFRFDPQDPEVAREVHDGDPALADSDGPLTDSDRTLADSDRRFVYSDPALAPAETPVADGRPNEADVVESGQLDATADDGVRHDAELASEQDLREADRLIAELDGRAARATARSATAPRASAPSTTAPATAPSGTPPSSGTAPPSGTAPSGTALSTAGRPTSTGNGHGPISGPQARRTSEITGPTTVPGPGRTLAPTTDPTSGRHRVPTGAPHTGPHRVTGADPAKKRSPWPYAIVGVAAVLVIALVTWLVLMPGDDEVAPPNQAGGSSSSEVSDWAAGICGELSDFQTAAMPVRAEVAKVTAASADGAEVSDVQREAAELLTSLATDLQTVGKPSGSDEAFAAHTTIISAVSAAATSAKAGGSSSVGTPEDTATAILSALDRPSAVFREAVAELPADERSAITSEETCTPLL